MKIESDVYCKKCGWEGLVEELNGIKCPVCGSAKDINDAWPVYDYDNRVLGGGAFNWNKK